MKAITANTRTVVKHNYALITPDGFVNSTLPGWKNCEVKVIINPAMGAEFSQLLIDMLAEGTGEGVLETSELFVYVISGNCQATVGNQSFYLSPGSYLFMPPGSTYAIESADAAQLLTFQKKYELLEGHTYPSVVQGSAHDLEPQMYADDPQLHMQYLLPDDLSFDMAVNIFTYQPGGNLPFVEIHVMEHGLIYLAGQGIYRLDEDWYAVQAGDSIWMAPYCPQWFTAMGKEPAVYIYYKNVNRYTMEQ